MNSLPSFPVASQPSAPLSWARIASEIKAHRRALLQANAIAFFAVLAAVPVPLLLPLMVDEVLLHHPGKLVAWIGSIFPAEIGRAHV